MNERVARTKTIEAAWELQKLLMAACINEFGVQSRGPGTGFELVPLCAFHPIDREIAKKVVAEFIALRTTTPAHGSSV